MRNVSDEPFAGSAPCGCRGRALRPAPAKRGCTRPNRAHRNCHHRNHRWIQTQRPEGPLPGHDRYPASALATLAAGAGPLLGRQSGAQRAGLFRRWGRVVFMRWALPVSGLPGLLILLAQPGRGVLLVALADFCMMFGSIVFNVAQTSARLEVCPPRMLGRMNATIRTAVWTCSTVGALSGAVLGLVLAPRTLILVGIVGGVVMTSACGLRVFPVPPSRRVG